MSRGVTRLYYKNGECIPYEVVDIFGGVKSTLEPFYALDFVMSNVQYRGAWNLTCWGCANFLSNKEDFLQDPDASFDFNDFDGDPKPRDENLENW